MRHPTEPPERPFLIHHRRHFTNYGKFIPYAHIVISPVLRTSGLLSLLSARQARLLLALLTFVSPNGQVQATAQQIAKALGLPTPLVAWWLHRFAGKRFQDMVFVYRVTHDEGQDIYALSRGMVEREHEPKPNDDVKLLPPSSKEAVMEKTRTEHAKPKAEVEVEVMRQLGHAVEELLDTPEGSVYRQMRIYGVVPEVTRQLLLAFGVERILNQLRWLPERKAKQPARYLVAAIRNNYPPPVQFGSRIGGGHPDETLEEDAHA